MFTMVARAYTPLMWGLLLSSGILSYTKATAQDWTVGVAIDLTIIDFPSTIFVTELCDGMSGQEAEFRIALPPVDGVTYFVEVDQTTNASDVFEFRHGTTQHILGYGEVMPIVPLYATDTIHLSYAGYESEVSIRFKAVGTPTVAGQVHPCGSTTDGWFSQPIGCYSPFFPDAGYAITCTVQGPSSIAEHEILTALWNGTITGSVEITDAQGRVVLRQGPSAGPRSWRSDQQAPGVYVARATIDGDVRTLRFVVVP